MKKDVTILITRIGDYRTSSKMKWIDFSTAYKQKESEVQYQAFSLMANNTVHQIKIACNLISNAVEVESTANLDKVS